MNKDHLEKIWLRLEFDNHKIGEMIGIVPEVENLVVFPSAPTLFNKGNGFEV